MSWTFAIPAAPVEHFEANAADAKAAYLASTASNVLSDEARAQVDKAVEAAAGIVASGVVGDGTVLATLSGHANADHRPTAGWANDCITVHVSCADGPATVAVAEQEQPAE